MANGENPPDYTTPVGVVRAFIPDTAVDADGDFIFSDDQINAYLLAYNGNTRRAAARAIDVIAVDQVLLLKYVRTDDLTVDGAKVADALGKLSKALRDEADASDANDLADGFQIVYPNYGGPCVPEATARPWGWAGCSSWG